MSDLQTATRDIALAEITVGKRLRQHRPELVEELAINMRANGQRVPIIVRATDRGYVLVAGLHRYLAANNLGWERIRAEIHADLQNSESKARVVEIIENLKRGELTADERAEHIRRYVAATETVSNETLSKSKGGRGKKSATSVRQIAKATGQSRATVHRALNPPRLPQEDRTKGRAPEQKPAAPEPEEEVTQFYPIQLASKADQRFSAATEAWNLLRPDQRLVFLQTVIAGLKPKRFVEFTEYFDQYRTENRNPDGTERDDDDEPAPEPIEPARTPPEPSPTPAAEPPAVPLPPAFVTAWEASPTADHYDFAVDLYRLRKDHKLPDDPTAFEREAMQLDDAVRTAWIRATVRPVVTAP